MKFERTKTMLDNKEMLYVLKRAKTVISQHHPDTGTNCCKKDIALLNDTIEKLQELEGTALMNKESGPIGKAIINLAKKAYDTDDIPTNNQLVTLCGLELKDLTLADSASKLFAELKHLTDWLYDSLADDERPDLTDAIELIKKIEKGTV